MLVLATQQVAGQGKSICWAKALLSQVVLSAVADPGFPVGGCSPRRGGVNSQCDYVL